LIIAVTIAWLHVVRREIADEVAVDLQVIERQVLQVCERAEAATEVVERKAASHAVQHADEAPRVFDVGDDRILGDLEADPVRRHASAVEALHDEFEKSGIAERLAGKVEQRLRPGAMRTAPRPSAVNAVCTTQRSTCGIRR
jgi:hypothetical protein